MAELPLTWTLIAESGITGLWDSVDGAVMTVAEARALLEDGLILMAQRRLGPNRMGLVVKAVSRG